MMLPSTRRHIAMWGFCGVLAAASMFGVCTSEAAYLRDVPQELMQPDGTTISCFASGDEYFHWLHDADDFVIVRDPGTGFWVWAAKERGEIVPTAHLVNQNSPQSLGLTPGIRPDSALLKSRRQLLASPMPDLAPSSGTIQNLVVFVRFSDDPEFSDVLSRYANDFNKTSLGASSLKAYFQEVSSGQLSINSTFYPTPPNNTVVSYQDSHPRAYYQPYDATTNQVGYSGDSEHTDREHTLLKNAADAVAAQIPSGLDIDSDSDGYVDSVVFIVKGRADGWSDLLWPHRWALYSRTAVIRGARVWDYNFQLSSEIDVGVLCHEMFHTLGAPDLYHYDESYRHLDPVGPWDIMEHDANPPQHMLVYMKQRYGGWLQNIPEITTSGRYALTSVAVSPTSAYRIASPDSSQEYFVVEYRRRQGAFESSLPASGLIVYRVNARVDGEGNADGPPDEVYIYRPGGTSTLNGNLNSANFSLNAGRTTIDDSTNPSSLLADGSPGGLRISEISAADDTISFTVKLSDDNPSCTYSISPSSRSHDSSAGSGTVSVTTSSGCSWTASSGSGDWLSITAGYSGNGNGSVSYSVAPNSRTSSRNGTLTIAGKTFAVSQAGSGAPPPSGQLRQYAVIARTTGAANSTWQSSLSLTNVSPEPKLAKLTYRYKVDASVTRNVTIPPFGLVEWVDTAVDLFGLSGKTSGVVEVETDGSILVATRTFNSSSSGTFGQSLPGATSARSLSFGDYGNINPVRRTPDFRTNIGIINTGSKNCSAILYFVNGGGFLIGEVINLNLAVGEWKQVNEALKTSGIDHVGRAYAVVEVLTVGAQVWAYGTVIDNNSGDPTALQMTIEQIPGDPVHHAVIAHTTGAANSVWQSSLSICNTSPKTASAVLSYRHKEGMTVVRNVAIPPYGLIEWKDAAIDLFGLGGKTAGVVEIEADAPIQVAVRTFNSSASGTFGQSLPGASKSRSMTYGQFGIITPIRRTANFRTNIGVINTGASSGSVWIYFIRSDGYVVGQTLNLSLAAGEWKQINEALDEAGISELDGGYAVIEVQNPGTSIWAYGTVIDNVSGDPTTMLMSIVE